MLIRNSVLVDGERAAQLLDLVQTEVARRLEKGRRLDDGLGDLLADLLHATTAHREISTSANTSASTSSDFRRGWVDGVPILRAATLIGCTTRNLRDRAARGTVPAAKQPDGSWLIDAAWIDEHRVTT